MRKHKGFTLIELLVVIAIIALLMSILMPALTRVSDQAKNAVCRSNLHQFAIAWKMFLDENQNKFPADPGEYADELFDYYKDEGLLFCPYAKKTLMSVTATTGDVMGDAEHAWGTIDDDGSNLFIASFGINQYCSKDVSDERTLERLYINSITTQGYRAPLMGDCANPGVTPQEKDTPPRWNNDVYPADGSNDDEIRSFVINRHVGKINLLFLDWSVRPVGLKEIFIIKWTKNWEMNPELLPEWPPWMSGFPNPYSL